MKGLFQRQPPSVALPEGMRYRAFLSYRSTDRKVAAALHRRLETYRTPKSLVGTNGEFGPVPARLGRIFRDREEARTADDVETILAGELSKSENLIVLCTPQSAASESWVGREIEIFRVRRPNGRVHAIIGGGTPPDCFPAQLLKRQPDGRLAQPFAADMRPRPIGGDGNDRAVVKLIAGLLGVPFDALWRREQRRTLAKQTQITVAIALAAFCVFGAMRWNEATARSRALAAASAFEFNEGRYDRAAFFALSALPRNASPLDVFWPTEAEQALRRTGIDRLVKETPATLVDNAPGSSRIVRKDRFLIERAAGTEEFAIVDLQTSQTFKRSFAAACAAARALGGGFEQCALRDLDLDGDGKTLLVSLADGSAWRIRADGLVDQLAPVTCVSQWKEVSQSLQEYDNSACDVHSLALSPSGRFAVLSSRGGIVTGFDLENGARAALNYSNDCGAQASEMDRHNCRLVEGTVTFAGDDSALLFRQSGRVTWWFFRGPWKTLDIPAPMDKAVSGPFAAITTYSGLDDKVVIYDTQTLRDDLAPEQLLEERVLQVGMCESLSMANDKDMAALLGCRISALAVEPDSAHLALAIDRADITIIPMTADAAASEPPERKLSVACIPVRSKLSFSIAPHRCSVQALRFSADGAALAAIDNDRTLRVFSLRDEPLSKADAKLIATIPNESGANFFGFPRDSKSIVEVLASGAVRWFDVAPAQRAQHAGALRQALCARLGEHRSPLVWLTDDAFRESQANHPSLNLSQAHRDLCAAKH